MNILHIILFSKFTILFSIKTIHLGFLFPLNSTILFNLTGYHLTGGIVSLALDKIKEEGLLTNYNIKVSTNFDNCYVPYATAIALKLINESVDVIFGPSCSQTVLRTYYLAKFYNKPMFSWGIQSYAYFGDTKKLPNLITLNPLPISIYKSVLEFVKQFEWNTLTFYAASNRIGRCSNILNGLLNSFETISLDETMVFTYITTDPPTKDDFIYFINNIKNKSRVILLCFDSDLWRRQFYLTLYDMKLNMKEYVLINIENSFTSFYTNHVDDNGKRLKFYEDYSLPNDGRNSDVMEIAQYSFFLDLKVKPLFNYTYGKEILKRIEGYPFYCNSCSIDDYESPSLYASNLYDAIYMWSKILNTTISLYGDKVFDDPTLYRKHCKGVYNSILNDFSYDDDCFYKGEFFITGLDSYGTITEYIKYSFSSLTNFTKTILTSDIKKTMFKKWDMSIPLDVPECGYLGENCKISFIKKNTAWFVVIIVVISIIAIIIISFIISKLYDIHKNNIKEKYIWRINPNNIQKIDGNGTKSLNLGSFHSNATSINSNDSFRRKKETNKYFYGFYNDRSIVGTKHSLKFINPKKILIEARDCFLMEHDNINKFFGMSIEIGQIYSIWKYCMRGSLFDIIEKDVSILDTYFLNSMIADLLGGLIYIHNSPLKFHGLLTSKKCLISDRWQLKISDFNTKCVRVNDTITTFDKLWIAPEILRSENYIGSTEGDIYSVAIIASEIFTKNYPWNYTKREESLEELVYLIKRGGSNVIRPDIDIPEGYTFNPSSMVVCREMWSENPNDRPKLHDIVVVHRELTLSKTKNLMDHVFATLEDYAIKLKVEVDNRSKEIKEEQKKSNILLQKMLPPQIAEKLKLGISVPPENYDNVTVFFSDIVKFTALAQKCSPFQVVNILNELFTQFDNIIESLDVYKVETTGDGYLCVSGLPYRNGDNHVVEIAKLALGFVKACNDFKIIHLPNEKVLLRIGCNTGPCTAGVVGLSMPRYCLFGDTVNTASRMESNGKPGRIHTTETFYQLLSSFGSFIMEHRGEVIIKGKGVMNTYWLNGLTGGFVLESSYSNANNT